MSQFLHAVCREADERLRMQRESGEVLANGSPEGARSLAGLPRAKGSGQGSAQHAAQSEDPEEALCVDLRDDHLGFAYGLLEQMAM